MLGMHVLDLRTCTAGEAERWGHLRALEWSGFPMFLLPLYGPILLIAAGWSPAVLIVAGAQIAWVYALRTWLPLSLPLSNLAAIVVGWLQWPVALGAAIGVFAMRSDVPMALAIAALPLGLGPIFAMVVELPVWWFMGVLDPDGRARAQEAGAIGTLQRRFLNVGGWVVNE